MKKYLFLIFVLGLFFLLPAPVDAQTVCEQSTVTVIARDADGEFIPDIYFEIWTQVEDVDGNLKPGERVASGRTDDVLGMGEATMRNEHGSYVLKMYQLRNEGAYFYFYNDLEVACGQEVEITETLSSLTFILRDAANELIKNAALTLYAQSYDADGRSIREKGDNIASLNTGETGKVKVFVPGPLESLNEKGGTYVMEYRSRSAGTYAKYDIHVSSGRDTTVNYILSDMKLVLRSAAGLSLPNARIEIYEQQYGSTNDEKLGTKVDDINTDESGEAIFQYQEGQYIARVQGESGQYQYFPDLNIVEGRRKTYYLDAEQEWSPTMGSCESDILLTLYAQDVNGTPVPGLNYQLYEQTTTQAGHPAVGKSVTSGRFDDYGKADHSFRPDPSKTYVLKIYDQSPNAGDFWFFNQARFICGQDKTITKKLPALRVVLRDAYGNLLKNQNFSIYTQKFDVDGDPIKERSDLVSSRLTTSEEGVASLFLAPQQAYATGKYGLYVLVTNNSNRAEFAEYGIRMYDGRNTAIEYMLSDMIVSLKDGAGRNLADTQIELYEQDRSITGSKVLGDRILSTKTDSRGEARFEYPHGTYALVVRDDARKENIFWNQKIADKDRVYNNIAVNTTRIEVIDSEGYPMTSRVTVTVYNLEQDETGAYYKGAKLTSGRMMEAGYAELSLRPGPYLFTTSFEHIEYGQALYTENGKLQNIRISFVPANEIYAGRKFSLAVPAGVESGGTGAAAVPDRLRGRILLQVEEHGEAWYVHPDEGRRYYMRNGSTAYEMMRQFGLGISNENLSMIPVGLDSRFNEEDLDGDGLADKLEEALGTDLNDPDSDGDGYHDGTEVGAGYNPLGAGKEELDAAQAEKLKGRILLQVESRGEAWYVNPEDGRRYYMKNGGSAYGIMRFLSLGITNQDLAGITEGELDDNN